MFRYALSCALLALAVAAPSFAQSSRSGTTAPAAMTSASRPDFRVEFSIFSRDRGRRIVSVSRPPVFIGALSDQTGITGFVKLSNGGQVVAVHAGGTIPGYGGQVQALTLDSMALSLDGQPPRTIAVGHALPTVTIAVPGM